MPKYRIDRGMQSCGQAIGVICKKADLPFIPGDLQNASSFEYPVIYSVVPEITTAGVESEDPIVTEKAVAAAIELEKAGVRCITSNSGYNLPLQRAVANAVKIPVGLSSLIQLPLISATLHPSRTIGVLCASSQRLTEEFMSRYGINVPNPLAIYGAQDEPNFVNMLVKAVEYYQSGAKSEEPEPLDPQEVAKDVVRMATRLVNDHPDTGAILFECTDFPPYAKVVQNAVSLPIFDVVTLVDYMCAGSFNRRYHGYM